MPQSAELPTAPSLTSVPPPPGTEPRRPNLRGDMDDVLEFLPSFHGAVRGYERAEVDSYVSWAERELRAARRSADEMAARFATDAVELDRLRQEAHRSAAGREAREISDRVAQILELAADEAAEITAAGAAEAEGLVAAARTYSAAMLRHARETEDAAGAERDRAAATCTEAAELREVARADAAQIRAAAVREQARLADAAADERRRLGRAAAVARAAAEEQSRRQREQETAAAAAVVAAARREIEQLHGQRDRARESLRQLTARIGDALETLAAGVPASELANLVTALPRERTPAG